MPNYRRPSCVNSVLPDQSVNFKDLSEKVLKGVQKAVTVFIETKAAKGEDMRQLLLRFQFSDGIGRFYFLYWEVTTAIVGGGRAIARVGGPPGMRSIKMGI